MRSLPLAWVVWRVTGSSGQAFAPVAETNDKSKSGQRASTSVLYGNFSQYSTFAVHTRVDDVQWFTADAENRDPKTGLPAIIRQSATFEEALP